MTTALVSHPVALDHITPPGHPEQVARITAIWAALEDMDLLRLDAPMAEDGQIERVHPGAYLEMLRKREPAREWASLDADTHVSPGSIEAAWRAAGGVIHAVETVMANDATNAFVAMRPPGHHAERQTPMGFCLLGNVAIGAKHAVDHFNLSRVAIIDFDVHHGNGTQNLIEDDARIFFASSHQAPLFPGSGAAQETGHHNNVLNVPMRAGSDGAAFRRVMSEAILPAVAAHKPEMIFISAGFDAHKDDPLADMNLNEDDFAWVTDEICALAGELCHGRVVSCLEGGYNLEALARCAAAHTAHLIQAGNKEGTK